MSLPSGSSIRRGIIFCILSALIILKKLLGHKTALRSLLQHLSHDNPSGYTAKGVFTYVSHMMQHAVMGNFVTPWHFITSVPENKFPAVE